jgi:hypothetical protein
VKIEDEITRRGIKLRSQGVELIGPCPKCGGDDRFAIDTEKQVWNCRGCGKGGDVIELVRHLDGCGFKAACATLTGEPPPKTKGNGSTKPWSPIVARYVYRQADGSPHQQVCRTAAKTFFQNRWNEQMWVSGAPDGAKIPYRLPELNAAPLTTPVHITEGEKDADNLAKLGFISTTNSGGAANWTSDLNEHFRDRHVYIHEDNDDEGRKRVQRIARALDPIAASVRVIRLPGLPLKGDVSDWLLDDPSDARLVKECQSAPAWDPSSAPEKELSDDDGADGEVPAVRKKQADVLIEVASAVELFHDRDDVGHARFGVNGHKENWPIRSKGFKRWLARGFYESTQSAPSSEAMQAALGVLEARAQFDAPKHEVHVRVAGHDGYIYIDLADHDWRAVEIDDDGWRVVDEPPVYFRRSSGMKPLPPPAHGGSLKDDLWPLLNLKTEHEFVLLVAWLVAALRPRGPYPVLALTGEQGSAKTLLAGFLRALIDPNSVPLRALPRNEHDVYIAARNSHVQAVDNASDLPDWLSDTYCRLATGGGFSTRQLYTDDDEALFGSTRPIILNGIDDIVTRPDLADRSIVLTLAAIPDDKRKLEAELWGEFERRLPRILGALLTAVSHGLRTLPDVKLERKPRMADFAVWATACEGAIWNKGTFMAAYGANIAEAVEIVLEGDQVATVLRSYINSNREFTGTATDLLKALNQIVPETQQKARSWPKRAANLAKVLRRIAPPLRKVGIEITFEPRDKHQRTIVITTRPVRAEEKPSPPSSPSLVNEVNGLSHAAHRHPTITATVTDGGRGDGGDGRGDNGDRSTVTANQLKTKENDSDDSISPTLTGGHVCAQCGLDPPDGEEQEVAYGEETIWLHRHCARFFVKNHVSETPPPPPEGRQQRQRFLPPEGSRRAPTGETTKTANLPAGAKVLGMAPGQRCELCGAGRDVFLIRRRKGEPAAPLHKDCAARVWGQS